MIKQLLVFCMLAAMSALATGEETRSIAITIDDAPRPDTLHFYAPARTAKLIETLAQARVEQVMFFCNSGRMDAAGAERIQAYVRAGHLVANHTHSHADLHKVGVDAFLADIQQAAQVLSAFPNYRPWFRFPFLHEGLTVEVRDRMRGELQKLGYRAGYVTVDTYDFHMDRMFQAALQAGKKIDFDRLRAAYVDLLTDSVEFYDQVARSQLGRSPRHVLLLHENDLAALYLGDLVNHLRDKGWKIISPEQAFLDPIATMEPDTLLLGQGRIIALATANGYEGPTRRWENEAELEREFARRQVWK
ncbi:polysaccharide deacetylase family protein [Steroidobacter sp. S1-65]|uniref:Polysaccharide deacetylase family protein n=1 Tax=Steroidobacter gossypii TaxID=2805490 RepID=A0ABS1X0R0_9GAMM|nr:polysaccharide deacetylase family protein [Steroidobacter gossypii]MBM0106811.1 polysaccharide deacetylase family protein [Steroidobacter gossypii]